jgi:hypothetical protein
MRSHEASRDHDAAGETRRANFPLILPRDHTVMDHDMNKFVFHEWLG